MPIVTGTNDQFSLGNLMQTTFFYIELLQMATRAKDCCLPIFILVKGGYGI